MPAGRGACLPFRAAGGKVCAVLPSPCRRRGCREILLAQELQPGEEPSFSRSRSSRRRPVGEAMLDIPWAARNWSARAPGCRLAPELPAAGVVEFRPVAARRSARRAACRQEKPSNRSISVAASGLMRLAGTRTRFAAAASATRCPGSSSAMASINGCPASGRRDLGTARRAAEPAPGAETVDDDAHVEIEPAVVGRDEIGFPSHRPRAGGGENRPGIRPASRQREDVAAVAHENDPGGFAGQPENPFRRTPRCRDVRRNLLRSRPGQRPTSIFPPPGRRQEWDKSHFFRQGDELVVIAPGRTSTSA